jgi:hypothetical protein
MSGRRSHGLTPICLGRPSMRQSLAAGSIASTAYLAAMAADMRLTRNHYDDLVFWGGFLTRRRRLQRMAGIGMIYGVGIAVTAVYQAMLPSLPRWPGWLLGAAFVGAENTLRFPTLAPVNAVHRSVRGGELPSLWTWRYFWVEADRHLAFGLVLGLLVKRKR